MCINPVSTHTTANILAYNMLNTKEQNNDQNSPHHNLKNVQQNNDIFTLMTSAKIFMMSILEFINLYANNSLSF